MRILFILSLFLFIPSVSQAQLVVRDGKPTTERTESAATLPDTTPGPAEAVIHGTDYPAKAITAIDEKGKVTDGSQLPVAQPNRKVAAEDDPRWPADTIPLFVASCAKMHRQLDPACTCIIQNLMKEMPHDEFMKLAKDQKVEGDERYQRIRRVCVGNNLSATP